MSIKVELKIIADHLRSSCFLIADGVLPSNEGRGYVLRRIMRRAMRQIHKLGAKEATMYKTVDGLIKEMGQAYPELVRARDLIIETLKIEEEKFRETLGKGLKILEEEISNVQNSKLSGKIAFKLYDTYGFPLDLTQDILKEKNLEVDIAEFDDEMEQQRKRGKENWAGSGETQDNSFFFELREKFGATKFIGYDNLKSNARVLAILDNPKAIILDQTPFYGTSGGQRGDDGIIRNNSGEIRISETKKMAGDLHIHLIEECDGEFVENDEVEAIVNQENRKGREKNHSATHLLHKALKKVLGNSISQKGSNVEAKYLTFDFNYSKAMSVDEIKKVEDLVNQNIQINHTSNTNLMELEKAKENGAEALFGEKYDNEVRVVKMGESVELCGGTHVSSTGEIGVFKIISEGSVASGIRRIEAISGFEVINYYRDKEKELATLHKNSFEELKKKDKEVARLKKQILLSNLDEILPEKIGEINFIGKHFEGVESKDLREISNQLKAKYKESSVFALFSSANDKVGALVAISKDLEDKFDSAQLIKPLVEAVGGKGGGGKKDMAFAGGSDVSGIANAISLLQNSLKL